MLVNEAKIAAQLNHPNIAQTLDLAAVVEAPRDRPSRPSEPPSEEPRRPSRNVIARAPRPRARTPDEAELEVSIEDPSKQIEIHVDPSDGDV